MVRGDDPLEDLLRVHNIGMSCFDFVWFKEGKWSTTVTVLLFFGHLHLWKFRREWQPCRQMPTSKLVQWAPTLLEPQKRCCHNKLKWHTYYYKQRSARSTPMAPHRKHSWTTWWTAQQFLDFFACFASTWAGRCCIHCIANFNGALKIWAHARTTSR